MGRNVNWVASRELETERERRRLASAVTTHVPSLHLPNVAPPSRMHGNVDVYILIHSNIPIS